MSDTLHNWLAANFPKTGVCEGCGRVRDPDYERAFDYAFRHHPEPRTRNRDDYEELCRTCHPARRGWRHTPEAKERIAAAKRGRKLSEETKRRISESHFTLHEDALLHRAERATRT